MELLQRNRILRVDPVLPRQAPLLIHVQLLKAPFTIADISNLTDVVRSDHRAETILRINIRENSVRSTTKVSDFFVRGKQAWPLSRTGRFEPCFDEIAGLDESSTLTVLGQGLRTCLGLGCPWTPDIRLMPDKREELPREYGYDDRQACPVDANRVSGGIFGTTARAGWGSRRNGSSTLSALL
jgi:hypothetical protein